MVLAKLTFTCPEEHFGRKAIFGTQSRLKIFWLVNFLPEFSKLNSSCPAQSCGETFIFGNQFNSFVFFYCELKPFDCCSQTGWLGVQRNVLANNLLEELLKVLDVLSPEVFSCFSQRWLLLFDRSILMNFFQGKTIYFISFCGNWETFLLDYT